jgi:hypothetical protein
MYIMSHVAVRTGTHKTVVSCFTVGSSVDLANSFRASGISAVGAHNINGAE